MKIKPDVKKSSIYIRSVEVKNLRTLNGDVILKFTKPDGTLPQWTLILGDNGIGKSTLLQCVAWMKPYLPDDSGKGQKLTKDDIEPTINNEENESLERLVRVGTDLEKDYTAIRGNFIANYNLNTDVIKDHNWCYSNMDIYLEKNGALRDVINKFDTDNEEIFLKNEIVMFGYSASRVLGKTSITEPNITESLVNFVNDTTVLYDAEEILHTINYAALGTEAKKEKDKYLNYLETVKQALVSVLPDFESVSDIEISAPKFVKNQIKQGDVFITTKHGKRIPFKDFSLGYKTVMSWVVDFSWRLFNAYPESKHPLKESAIIIVDEIDLHLHPVWQREIINHLSQHFPKVQFIATAHSPLMVQAALKENYAVLKFVNGEVTVINEPTAIDGWRVDQILTSEFFGLKTARGIDYENMLAERQSLVRKSKLSKPEKERLNALSEQLAKYPTGESEDEIENRKFISDVVEKLKKDKVTIQL